LESAQPPLEIMPSVLSAKPKARPRGKSKAKAAATVLSPEERAWAKSKATPLLDMLWSIRVSDLRTLAEHLDIDTSVVRTRTECVQLLFEKLANEDDLAAVHSVPSQQTGGQNPAPPDVVEVRRHP
jgi:hypothetical protein